MMMSLFYLLTETQEDEADGGVSVVDYYYRAFLLNNVWLFM